MKPIAEIPVFCRNPGTKGSSGGNLTLEVTPYFPRRIGFGLSFFILHIKEEDVCIFLASVHGLDQEGGVVAGDDVIQRGLLVDNVDFVSPQIVAIPVLRS